MGMIMPRHARMNEEVTRRIEDFVVTLLLPVFFVYTGLRTNVGLLDRPELWLITLLLIAVAILGKLAGAAIAARVAGYDWKASAVIGTLMNTRGLTELIVLNLALDAGAISNTLFAMLVIMAVVTTLMAGPLLKLLDPKNEYGRAVEDEFADAALAAVQAHPELPVPDRSILVAPQTDGAIGQLVALAEPLARSAPPRELIIARLVRPPRGARRGRARRPVRPRTWRSSGPRGDQRGTRAARRRGRRRPRRRADVEQPRARTWSTSSSASPSTWSSPMAGGGCGRGRPARRGRRAPGERRRATWPCSSPRRPIRSSSGPTSPILVPFGGAEHDWAALELGSWLAAEHGAPLKLLGAAGQTDEGKSVTRHARRRRPARPAGHGHRDRAAGRGRRPRRHRGGGGDRRACSCSACPTGGARRASARPGRRSPRRRPPRCCSSVAARVPDCSHRRRTSPSSSGRWPADPGMLGSRRGRSPVRRHGRTGRRAVARRAADLGLLTASP